MPTNEEARLLGMPDDAYMNDEQLSFFRELLLEEKRQVESHLRETRAAIASQERDSDALDQASVAETLRLQLRQAERETRLLVNIDLALGRIDEGSYGYCEETDEPIGLRRLMFRPTARLCLEAKENQERREHHYAKLSSNEK